VIRSPEAAPLAEHDLSVSVERRTGIAVRGVGPTAADDRAGRPGAATAVVADPAGWTAARTARSTQTVHSDPAVGWWIRAYAGGMSQKSGDAGGDAVRPAVRDRLARPLRDLRISVTDRCNFRCGYCMPRDVFGPDHAFLPRSELLSYEELARLVRVFADLGVSKVRLTGGEPLLRRDLEVLVSLVASTPPPAQRGRPGRRAGRCRTPTDTNPGPARHRAPARTRVGVRVVARAEAAGQLRPRAPLHGGTNASMTSG
jgi:hypothetical protein